MQFTIATWNIAGARPVRPEGHLSYDAEDIGYFVTHLQAVHPDIICFQETHVSNTRSVAREIAALLGNYKTNETVMSPSHIDAAYSLGNAMLSKLEPISVRNAQYPYPQFPIARIDGVPTVRHDKGFQQAQFSFGQIANTQMQPLKFLGTPYESEKGRAFAREMELVLLAALSRPLVFCGDINSLNPAELYPELLLHMLNALPDEPTRPDGKKTDFIFYSPEFTLLDSGIVQTRTDHYLCYARFEIAEEVIPK